MTNLLDKAHTRTLRVAIKPALLCGVLLVTSPLHAQIYESEGPDGTPTFSDTPAPGSREVQLPEENVADPDEWIPAIESAAESAPAAPHSTPAEEARKPAASTPAYRPSYLDEHSGEQRKEVLDAGQRDEVFNADERDEVTDAGERREVGEVTPRDTVEHAGQRDEVGEAGERHEVGHKP